MSGMTHKYIAVSYRLFIDGDNGKELVEEATKEQPFYFMTGFGIALDAFEKKLIDVPQGEDFDFSLEKEEAYGDYVLEHVVELDREIFTIDGKFDHEHIFVDAVVPLQNEDGNRFYGKILEIGEEKVKVDLNHPLAGETLHFVGKVLENREATEDEVRSMIARMSGGCGGCGGGCQKDGCGSDCNCGSCGGCN